MDGDCDSEPVDFWVCNNATYDKLIPAVRRTFAIPALIQVHQWKGFSAMGALCCARTEQECPTNFCLNWCFLKCNIVWTSLDVGLCKIIKDGQINVIN